MKQLNIKINDELAEAIYAKIKKEKCQIKTLVEGFFEKWLNEKGKIEDEKKLENRVDEIEKTLFDENILTRIQLLEQSIKPLLNNVGILTEAENTLDKNKVNNTLIKESKPMDKFTLPLFDIAPSVTPAIKTEQTAIEKDLVFEVINREFECLPNEPIETEFDPNETLEQHLEKLKGKKMSAENPLANLNLGILNKNKRNFDFSICDSDQGFYFDDIQKLIPNDRAKLLKQKPPEEISHLVKLVLGFSVRCEKKDIIQKSKPNKISITIFKL
jgi:hypothetical protein